MGRVSKYEKRRTDSGRRFNAALYVRLSREDGDREESDSVDSQRSILKAFAEDDKYIDSYEFYVDDGYTGTDFDRPAVKKMLLQIESGNVNCVVVKDLSRLGRNYIEVGRYLEQIFPSLGVRFISISDNIDSYLMPSQSNTIIVPFKNLINDEYSRDISQKIRTALDIRRKRGDFIGSFACYGYKKSDERGKLVIDEETAPIVKRIFEDFIAGKPKNTIARELNLEGVPSPSEYKRRKNKTYVPPGGNGLWSFSSVNRILSNPIYTGDMVQARSGVVSYKVHKTRARPESEWIVSKNTHEPIITREQFERAAEMQSMDVRADMAVGAVHPLSGFVKCAECGRALSRRSVKHRYGVYNYYICPTYKQSHEACTKHSVRVDKVEKTVLDTIREQIQRTVDMERLSERSSRKSMSTAPQLGALKRELSKIMLLKQSAYEDWKLGDISREEFRSFKESYDERERTINGRIAELENYGSKEKQCDPVRKLMLSLEAPETLSRSLVASLIRDILIHEDGRITINFKFRESRTIK